MTRIIRRSPPRSEPSPALQEATDILLTSKSDDDDGGSSRVDHVAIIRKYAAKVTNRATAIRAKCVECSGGSLSEVRDCPVTKCALWPYRQGDDPGNKKTRERLAREAAASKQPDEEDVS